MTANTTVYVLTVSTPARPAAAFCGVFATLQGAQDAAEAMRLPAYTFGAWTYANVLMGHRAEMRDFAGVLDCVYAVKPRPLQP
jgi:hypothetical protein